MIKVNGVQFELDTMDLEISEKIEQQLTEVPKKLSNVEQSTRAEGIKETCNVVSNCFDEILGKGAAEKIFKGKKNFRLALKCFEQFVDEIKREDMNMGNELNNMTKKYSPNRVARRNNKSNGQKFSKNYRN